MPETVSIRLWLIGLFLFAIVIAIGTQITHGGVTFGIVDHQAAATAAKVDEIQAQWREGGVRTVAIVAMLGDLIFIGVYGWGAYVAGRDFLRSSRGVLRAIGLGVMVAAAVFLLTDYLETTLQLIQLLQDTGIDWMAGAAATAQPIKIAAWIATFVGVSAAKAIERFSTSAA